MITQFNEAEIQNNWELVVSNNSSWIQKNNVQIYIAVLYKNSVNELLLVIWDMNMKLGSDSYTTVKPIYQFTVGSLEKPELGMIRTILSKYNNKKTNCSFPYERTWLTPYGKRVKLKDYLQKLSKKQQ